MPRPKKCAAQRNPPVTASPCQGPLGKGAEGAGTRIATTSDIGHWFAMTEVERICVSFRDQSADWSWESVIPQHKGRGERIATASVRTGCGNDRVFYKGCGASPVWAVGDMVIVYTLYFYIQKSERKHEL